MADSPLSIGSRDDVRIEASRCLRMRFSESGCRCCAAICPHGAITLDGGLAIDSERCRGCLLCTSVCPAGAVEQNSDFSACLAQLSRVPEPVLGCLRTKERSNASLPCLGGLSEEHLLALRHSSLEKVTLNLSLCSDCPNNQIISQLEQRLEALFEAGLSHGFCQIYCAKSAQDIQYRDESMDRRSFFKSFRTSLFTSAAVILSANPDQTEHRTEYAGKRLPRRRELLNGIRKNLSAELEARIRKRFDSHVSFDVNCTSCHGCVAICPAGALQSGLPGTLPLFDHLLCTGCGLCVEFCLDGAVRLSPADDYVGVDRTCPHD